MKCSMCGGAAVINMRQHKLRLCTVHFLDWFPRQVQRTIEKWHMFARDARVLVAVSGGKDSLALWDVLLRLGYRADGLYINLGIPEGDYSAESLRRVQAFVASMAPGSSVRVVDVAATYGASVPGVARRAHRAEKMCSVCGLIKRHIMNRVAHEDGYDVIATGHNLDDEAATLLQNALHWEVGYLARQAPVLEATHPRLARKVKPLACVYERESAAYALVRGIDYIQDECPHSLDAKSIFFKELLNRIEERSLGAKSQFYARFLQAKGDGRLVLSPERPGRPLHDCMRCGQPTTSAGLCQFCRLWE